MQSIDKNRVHEQFRRSAMGILIVLLTQILLLQVYIPGTFHCRQETLSFQSEDPSRHSLRGALQLWQSFHLKGLNTLTIVVADVVPYHIRLLG